MKTRRFTVLSLTILSLWVSCAGQTNQIKMYDKWQAMKKEILKWIAPGSSIQTAKILMEQNKFNCELSENSAFSEDTDDPNKPILHEGADFLACHKSQHVSSLIIREWSVIITHNHQTVADVFVNTGLTGP